MLEIRLDWFQYPVAFDILDPLIWNQSESGTARSVDIVSAVQDNFKWLESELNSFQGVGMSKIIHHDGDVICHDKLS